MIHVSRDKDKDAALKWAKSAGFPWLTVLDGKIKRSGLNDYRMTKYIPEYHLIDAQGKTVAQGATACFMKLETLK